MKYNELKGYINSEEINALLIKIKGTSDLYKEKERYLNLLNEAYKRFGDGDYHLISSPGRTEIGGNHTDHQHGHTLAATINYDNICIFKKNEHNICNFIDSKFDDCVINLNDLKKNDDENYTSKALIRGIAARLFEDGYKIGGFDAVCDSLVAIGSGISSSACFEIMIVEIFNCLYNDLHIEPVERALIGQYAENVYFNKASGLLDQLTISIGGFVALDFKNPKKPLIENYDFNFYDYDYEMMLVNTKGDHSDLSKEYSAIPSEMKKVANLLSGDFLRDCNSDYFFTHLKELREETKNDRAILRAFHFFTEDQRAILEKEAIRNKDIDRLLDLINRSGRSSYMYLQNIYPNFMPFNQPLSIALAISDYILGNIGAYRVHGGGFGGTIQAIVPKKLINDYKMAISSVFGEDSIMELVIRPFGTKTLI